MTVPAAQKTQIPHWEVKDRNSWNILFQESIAHYWNLREKNKDDNDPAIYLSNIYAAMGVLNIKETDDPLGSVIFYSNNEPTQEMVKVVADYTKMPYVVSRTISNDSGWTQLRSHLTVKIPNSTLIDSIVESLLAAIDYKKLDELCCIVLGNPLYSYYKFLIEGKKDGDYLDVEKHLKDSVNAYKEFDHISVVKIPGLLTLLGILDALILNYQKVCQDIPAQERLERLEKLMGWINAAIYTPLTTLLSSYISLGVYFPFGLNMSEDTNSEAQDALAGLRSNLFSTFFGGYSGICAGPEGSAAAKRHMEADDAKEIVDTLHDHYAGPQERCSSGGLAPGDRGGATGLDDDYAWEHFIPRLIAYNWESLRSMDERDRIQIIKNNTSLRDYQAMLHNLGYRLPDFVDVYLKLEDELPFELNIDNPGEPSSMLPEWNYRGYISELEIAYPDPPPSPEKPMALCDLVAKRAAQPFTTF